MRILIIEDEPKTNQSLRQGFEEIGWKVDATQDGASGLKMAIRENYDVIVSDIIVPEMNGLDFCRNVRKHLIRTPILLISALGQTDDKVTGLEAGADDYLSKPFEFKEMVARIKALGRRHSEVFKVHNVLQFADLEMNMDTKIVKRMSTEIQLTPREFALLEYFIRNNGRVLSKIEIAEKVWDVDFDTGTNVIEVYVNYLRNKIDKHFEPKLIHTQFGQGYIFKV